MQFAASLRPIGGTTRQAKARQDNCVLCKKAVGEAKKKARPMLTGLQHMLP